MHKWILYFATLPLLLQGEITQAQFPLVEGYENGSLLEREKYTTKQWEKIQRGIAKEDRLRLMSYNMLMEKYDSCHDKVHNWKYRVERIAELILATRPDVIATQELMEGQIADLLPRLEGYTYLLVRKAEEMIGLFYLEERLEVIESGLLISDEIMRVQFRDKRSGKQFVVYNSHFSYYHSDERERSVEICSTCSCEESLPLLIAGDYNTFPNWPTLQRLHFFDGDYLEMLLQRAGLIDARRVSLLGHLGPLATFTDDSSLEVCVPFSGLGPNGVLLDHIYVNDLVEVLISVSESAKVEGHFPSDHLPIFIDYLI